MGNPRMTPQAQIWLRDPALKREWQDENAKRKTHAAFLKWAEARTAPMQRKVADELIRTHKIPVDGLLRQLYFIMELDGASCAPSPDEILMLKSYEEFTLVKMYGRDVAVKQMAAELAIVAGHNTITFFRYGNTGVQGWAYRRQTWTMGSVPVCDGKPWHGMVAPLDLESLLDGIESFIGDVPSKNWRAWKVDRPHIFGSQGPFKVEMQYASGWGDAEWQDNGKPMRFASRAGALRDIEEHCYECASAVSRGDMQSGYSLDEYRVVPAHGK